MNQNELHGRCLRSSFVAMLLLLIGYVSTAYVWNSWKIEVSPQIAHSEIPQSYYKVSSTLSTTLSTSKALENSLKLALKKALENSLKLALKKAKEKVYTIVLWGPRNNTTPIYPIDFDNCGACTVTYNKSKFYDEDSKALVVYFNKIHRPHPIPTTRRKDQIFVWWSLEAPPALSEARNLNLHDIDGVFNLTMTYRRDSDIYDPYGMASWILRDIIESSNGDPMKKLNENISKKTGLVTWIVSNCNYVKGAIYRLKFANQLIDAGLKLDPHGKCFPKYPKAKDVNIIQHYKFYLSFENSMHCVDYITEKFFINALSVGTVPIVLGATKADYEKIFPSGSFIYAEDFESPKKLVDYLNYLDKNITAYKEYFNWWNNKEEDMPNYNRTTGFCQLCRFLHGINIDNTFNPRRNELESFIPTFGFPNKSRTTNIRNWFYGTENRDCLPHY